MSMDLLSMSTSVCVFPLAAAGPDVQTVLWVAWAVCGVLLVLISLMIAAWLYRDCQARGAPTALWTVLGIIPVANLVALCVYVFAEGREGTPSCPRHQQPFIPGQQRCLMCFQEEMVAEQERMFDQIRAEREGGMGAVPDPGAAPDQVPLLHPTGDSSDRRLTAPIATAPSTVISLQQIGGVRHGMTTNLTTRNPFGQRIRNTIGRDANCSLPVADDESASSQHCTIGEDEEENFYVADLDSFNGTSIIRNGEETKVQSGRHGIQDGDILRVGRTEFRVIITRPPSPATPQPL